MQKNKATAAPRKPSCTAYAIAVFMFLMGLGWAGLCAWQLLIIYDVNKDGQNTKATITVWDKVISKGGSSVQMDYAYQVGAQSYQGADDLPGSAYTEHGVGDTIDIAYSRRHPEHSITKHSGSISGAMLSLVCGLSFAALGVKLAFAMKPTPDASLPDTSAHPNPDTNI